MALADEHGGTETAEAKGRIAFYRGESVCPYPEGHAYCEEWSHGYQQARQREEQANG